MSPVNCQLQACTRRHFLHNTGTGIGSIALSSLLGHSANRTAAASEHSLQPHFTPRTKNIIYLHMAGSPPQHELFDYKPKLVEHHLQPCPQSLLENQRFAFIKGHPNLLGTPYQFSPQGQSGTLVSELLPHFGKMIDKVAVIKSMHTDQFNHAPAQLLLYTGSPRFGHASMGAWATYGLGSENQNLPGFVVLTSGGTDPSGGKSLWGSGFLPSVHQGVQCRTEGAPILYANNPKGMNSATRRRSLDALRDLNERQFKQFGDPETESRIEQYELAYRMQIAVPEVMDIRQEPQHIHELYNADPQSSSFANNCLLARRLIEQGVRFVQLFDWGWDIHGTAKSNDIVHHLPEKCKQVDQPIAALIKDLDQRGLLDETLIVWSGEFGRTSMNEERNGSKFLGRDHHPHCFSMWMAGGGIKGGISYGETDELGFFITENQIEVHDLQATILHLLGFDPFRFQYSFQGLNHRLIGPEGNATIQHGLIA